MHSEFYGTELVHSQVCQLLLQMFHKNAEYVSWRTREYTNLMKQPPAGRSQRYKFQTHFRGVRGPKQELDVIFELCMKF